MFSPFELPQPIFLLVTDELASPADFALHQTLVSHLKQHGSKQSNLKRIYLSVSESWNRLQMLCSKSGVNISQNIPLKSLHFIDVLSHLSQCQSSPNTTASPAPLLRTVYDQVALLLTSENESLEPGSIVILDDISSLEWTSDHSPHDLTQFCRALRALCLKTQTTLIIRHHIVTPDDPDPVLRNLKQMCSYHMDVRPLSSGRSGAVSGEIALHAGPTASLQFDTRKVQLLSRQMALQYRLTDNSVVFFERGSSRGVL
ncbi:hypothetical protein AAF712_004713 [Marasmius tenuissimus]|uniref:Elongator complex protein 6 n=1 Tax=Marasmius tenuissimus TaxID=585030 RepID=A0ABR3A4Q9_9AGAR